MKFSFLSWSETEPQMRSKCHWGHLHNPSRVFGGWNLCVGGGWGGWGGWGGGRGDRGVRAHNSPTWSTNQQRLRGQKAGRLQLDTNIHMTQDKQTDGDSGSPTGSDLSLKTRISGSHLDWTWDGEEEHTWSTERGNVLQVSSCSFKPVNVSLWLYLCVRSQSCLWARGPQVSVLNLRASSPHTNFQKAKLHLKSLTLHRPAILAHIFYPCCLAGFFCEDFSVFSFSVGSFCVLIPVVFCQHGDGPEQRDSDSWAGRWKACSHISAGYLYSHSEWCLFIHAPATANTSTLKCLPITNLLFSTTLESTSLFFFFLQTLCGVESRFKNRF